jgi:glycosyltransferase involved in cell wall biosynthesis
MGGFEGADHRSGHGHALDMVASSGHADEIDADFARCARMGLRTVRESIGWRLCEPSPGRYDFSRMQAMAQAGRRHGVQVLWTLMHYGMPADLHVMHPDFVPRFTAFAEAAMQALKPFIDDDPLPPVITPVNEIGFLAWILSETQAMAGAPPTSRPVTGGEIASSLRSGYEIKRQLARAALSACRLLRQSEPRVRFMHIEPVLHVVAPRERPDLEAQAREVASYQWQAWDLLCGRLDPELGGAPDYLDLLGINYYHSGQWETGTEKRLYWHLKDERRVPFGELAKAAWQRYRQPMIVAETSHIGVGRAQWLDEMAAETERVRAQGVPLLGLCLYPIIDRHDWDDAEKWHRSGLWDAAATEFGKAAGPPQRVLCRPYAKTLRRWQRRLPASLKETKGRSRVSLTPSGGLTRSGRFGGTFITSKKAITMTPLPPIVVFSHLRWDFVFQRPQHLLSRLARHRRVLFIEEPVQGDGPAHLEYRNPCDQVLVLRPVTPLQAHGFHDDQLSLLQPLLQQLIADEQLSDYIAWFYTPMALPLLADLQPLAVVYDCMDELSAFRHAPLQMRQRESALLKRADLVLTGGPSLYEAKRALHRNVHCLPSSVDAQHFAPDRVVANGTEYLAAERLQGQLPAPKLGFFGVIDERIDLGLIDTLAEARPDWQFVMVGPVVKIDPAALPRRPNVHWLGQQPYTRLPALVAGWDVCLMPFALNEHTRFISPTKTLEYLAAEKPVVSTAVKDVVSLYGPAVRIADSAEAFLAACELLLHETPEQCAERLAVAVSTVARHSWDEAARHVETLVGEAVAAQRAITPLPEDGFPLAATAGA